MYNLEACYVVNCSSKSSDFLPPCVRKFEKHRRKSAGKKTKNDQLNNASDGNKRTCCNLAGFVPTMDLDETSMEVS